MEKLMVIYHLRVDEQTNAEIERLAALEHRPKEYQVRHLIALGIKQTQHARKSFPVENGSELLGAKKPHRITNWNGVDRRRESA